MDEEELEEAVDIYLNSANSQKLAEVASKIRLLCKQFTGESQGGGSASGSQASTTKAGTRKKELSAEELVQLLEDFRRRTVEQVEEYSSEFVSRFGSPAGSMELQNKFHTELGILSEQ